MAEVPFQLAREVVSAHLARTYVQKLLRSWNLDDLAGDVTLLTSELVTNAVLHAGNTPTVDHGIELRMCRIASGVRVEVADGSALMPHVRPPNADGGRGLHIVEAISSSWGTLPNGTGKTVWFEVTH